MFFQFIYVQYMFIIQIQINLILKHIHICIYEMIDQQFEQPAMEMQFDIQFQPLQNQSLVMEQSKLIFPKVDLVIGKNGIQQLSNPQNVLTKFKILPSQMTEKQVIGKGSAGTVKRAIYNFQGKQMNVAIKQILADEKQKRDQLLNDLRTFLTGQMSPYLVTFYGCYYHAGLVKQVIEYMNLGSLKNLTNLVQQKKVSIDEKHLAQITRRILQGLNHIHKNKHQIHRDIKPENILINESGDVKITDFGITKYIENTFGQAQTFVGTTIYMSPERIGFQKKYDYKCDAWSLGLVLYELATGAQLPYTANKKEPIMMVLNRIVKQQPPSLQGSGRSQQLIDFLKKSLHKNPEGRLSVQQLLKHQWIVNNANQVSLESFMLQVKNLLDQNIS